MEIKLFATVFATVFLAELGDKTQMATLLYAADPQASKLAVFIAASVALICASALAVAAGGLVATYVSPRILSRVAGAAFVAVGLWTIVRA